VPSLPPPLKSCPDTSMVCGAESMQRLGVRPSVSVCLSRRPTAAAAGLLVQGWKKSVLGFHVFKNLNSGKVEQN